MLNEKSKVQSRVDSFKKNQQENSLAHSAVLDFKIVPILSIPFNVRGTNQIKQIQSHLKGGRGT